eukprot:447629-Alexandrium_andersonii.AAC.1
MLECPSRGQSLEDEGHASAAARLHALAGSQRQERAEPGPLLARSLQVRQAVTPLCKAQWLRTAGLPTASALD